MKPGGLDEGIVVHLTPDQFQALWNALEETGVLDLRQHSGREPPEGVPYFRFDDTQNVILVTRPGVEGLEAWAKAKQVMVEGRVRGVSVPRREWER